MEQHQLREKICSAIDKQYILDLLERMVSIDSTIGNESELASFIGEECKKLGLPIEYDQVTGNRENIYTHKQFSSDGRTLTFNGHMDTVDIADGWETDPMRVTRRDNLLLGLGVADMKAGIACQLAAFKALIQHQGELKGTLHFTAVVDEESHGMGARKMVKHEFYGRTDGILIAEPFFGDTDLDGLPLGMTGKVLYEINVQGKSAHAFRPEFGINAISDAAIIVEHINKIYKVSDDEISGFQPARDAHFGEGSFCVLKIDGGYQKYNVSVPESCQIILNRLTLPHETKNSVLDDLKSLIDDLSLQSTVDISLRPPYYQAYKISDTHQVYTSLNRAYQDIFKRKPMTTYGNMISDANIFMGVYGIPTVNFGPKGYNLHGANEGVEVDLLKPTSEVMVSQYLYFQN